MIDDLSGLFRDSVAQTRFRWPEYAQISLKLRTVNLFLVSAGDYAAAMLTAELCL